MGWFRDGRQGRLLAKARAGDRAAFRALYRELYGPVFAFASRRLARREDAEDLTARVFERLLARLDDFDPARGSVLVFAISIARNAVIDHLRTRHDGVDIAALAEVLPDPAVSALDLLLRGEEAKLLARMIARLPADARELLAMRFGDELSHAEIAAATGRTPAAVRQSISRTLRELKEERRRISADIDAKRLAPAPRDAGTAQPDDNAKPGAIHARI